MPMRSVARRFMAATRAFCLAVMAKRGSGSATTRRLEGLERRLAAIFRHVGIGFLHGVHALLDFAHGVDVFHQALVATVVDDQALGAGGDGNLGRLEAEIFDGHAGQQLHVDEGAQALVLAEVAARVFAAVRDVGDLLHGFEADESWSGGHSSTGGALRWPRRWRRPRRNARAR